MSPDSTLELVAGFFAVVLALALASVLLRPLWLPLWHLFRGTQQFLEDWNGEPARLDSNGRPISPGRPSAMARLAQLETNSGSTMRDQVAELVVKVDRISGAVETVRESAAQATTAAGVAVGEAKAGRAITSEAAENSRAQVAELRGVVAGLAGAMTAEGQELRSSIEVMREEITDEAAHRYADALDLLAEHGGPDLRPYVAPHVHNVDAGPSNTSGPVVPDDT